MEEHTHPTQSKSLSRREFITSSSTAAMLGGGVLMAKVGKSHESKSTLPFGDVWRPSPPRRLSEVTHALAARALSGEHGRALRNAEFSLNELEVFGCSADKRYAFACKAVAEKAPLRILPGERVVGSATLREAAGHATPVANVPSTSHTTIGFDRVLKMGYRGLREQIRQRLARGNFEPVSPLVPIISGPKDVVSAVRFVGDGRVWAEGLSQPEYAMPPITVECWAKVDFAGPVNVLVLNRNKSSSGHWELYTQAGTGFLAAYVPACSPCEIVSKRNIVDGKWHHVAMTFAADRLSLYVDGECVASENITLSPTQDEAPGLFYIGGYPPESLGCEGAISEVRLSRGVLPIDPNAKASSSSQNLLGVWQVDFRDGRPVFEEKLGTNNTAPVVLVEGGKDLLESMLICLDAAAIWHKRHMEELARLAAGSTGEERETYLKVMENLRNVPENPPSTFYEAVQSLWFMYVFQRLMGNWSGIGRIDEMLGPYLKKDLAEGRITLDEAREILAHFWIKGCEWTGAHHFGGTGDAQFYQNIILSGVDEDGNDVTNEVTYLVLDIVEELHISDFPIAVRINRRTGEKLLRRIAEVQRHGGGIVAVYNEDTVIEGLVKFGYSLREARRFTNDGCWEVLVPGKTAFIYAPFDMLALLHGVLGLHDSTQPPPEFPDFETLYARFLDRLREHLDGFHAGADNFWNTSLPAPLLSMFVDDCIERGRGYHYRGAHYNVLAPHAGGMANVANSLLVIKKLVYEQKYLTLSEFVDILRRDYEGEEALRRLILSRFVFYGNDDDEADEIMERLFNDYTALAARVPERNGVLRPPGISTFGREIGWRLDGRGASPDGHHRGEILATNFSPSPGTDFSGPTAVIKSYCKMDLTRVPNGATIELKIHPQSVKGEEGLSAMVGLLKGFVRLGGFYMHVDVVDSAMLLDAQRHPEKYPNLAVRVAGWSARFATLDKDWQDMIINRTQQIIS
ncbi:MAG TPA: pyruvate formate lyase family protein [Candidatus Hydrogenedentes bacterium]|nr:pyruvate formate lyase family protein [Candidatus Hydrogenedentota bacterium]